MLLRLLSRELSEQKIQQQTDLSHPPTRARPISTRSGIRHRFFFAKSLSAVIITNPAALIIRR